MNAVCKYCKKEVAVLMLSSHEHFVFFKNGICSDCSVHRPAPSKKKKQETFDLFGYLPRSHPKTPRD